MPDPGIHAPLQFLADLFFFGGDGGEAVSPAAITLSLEDNNREHQAN